MVEDYLHFPVPEKSLRICAITIFHKTEQKVAVGNLLRVVSFLTHVLAFSRFDIHLVVKNKFLRATSNARQLACVEWMLFKKLLIMWVNIFSSKCTQVETHVILTMTCIPLCSRKSVLL